MEGDLEMPVTKHDVLEVLADPKLMKMGFTVGTITVNHQGYRNVYDYIQAEDIQVLPGKETVAFYDGRHNTLITQAGTPPLGLSDRVQILHECTHALIDISGLKVLRLHDEVAAYLAQVTYAQIESPSSPPRSLSAVGASPMGKLVFAMLQVVHSYGLHSSKGFGARIEDWDLVTLTKAVQAFPAYGHVKASEISVGAGVPVKNNQMRALRAALTQGRRN
jgi:hypothetical protein